MNKKGQVSIAAVILVVIAMMIIFATILVILLRPDLFNVFKEKEHEEVRTTGTVVSELRCNSPYIKVGNECCLDSNYNGICDRDDQYLKPTPTPIENIRTCIRPYINRGGLCCLDRDYSGICDMEEDFYSSSSTNIRIRNSDIDSPFDINSIDATRRDLSFDLRNDGSKDVIVTKVKVDDCDTITPDKTIVVDKEKSFNLDCDFGTTADSDITVEYMEVGGNTTLTAEGNVRIDFRYYDYNYDTMDEILN